MFPKANLLAWYGKKLHLTQQKHAFANQKKCTTTQRKSEEKKDKWQSIRYKQANNIYSAKIKNRIKGALRPGAHMGLNHADNYQQLSFKPVKYSITTAVSVQ